jgi:hypothetical protein
LNTRQNTCRLSHTSTTDLLHYNAINYNAVDARPPVVQDWCIASDVASRGRSGKHNRASPHCDLTSMSHTSHQRALRHCPSYYILSSIEHSFIRHPYMVVLDLQITTRGPTPLFSFRTRVCLASWGVNLEICFINCILGLNRHWP